MMAPYRELYIVASNRVASITLINAMSMEGVPIMWKVVAAIER
jgi:hypothetical protein